MGTDPDPAAELCRLLNINRKQLPTSLDLSELSPEDQKLVEGELLGIVHGEEEAAQSRESGLDQDVTDNSNAIEADLETRIDPVANEGEQPPAGFDPRFFGAPKTGPTT